MRIVSWNCYRGDCRSRASLLSGLNPNIIILQECAKPASTDAQCLWFGTRPIQGVGVIANGPWRIKAGPLASQVPDSAYPIEVSGPASFHILAVWALPKPTYVRALLNALEHYRDFLHAAPAIVVGDFNSRPRWDAKDPRANHSVLDARLRDEFSLRSAFHSHAARSGNAEEPPTLYWRWNKANGYHLDYCYIPEAWTPRVRSVEIGGYDEWAEHSDHRPLTVEIED